MYTLLSGYTLIWTTVAAAIFAGAAVLFYILGKNPFNECQIQSQWVVVQSHPISKDLYLHGTLVSKQIQSISPPHNSRITSISAVPGERVRAGDPLVTFDSDAIELDLLDARANFATADQQLKKLRNWNSSPEVVAATRSFESAKRRERLLNQQAEKTQTLYERGIISGNELSEVVVRSLEQQEETISKREALTNLMGDGLSAKLKFAEFDYETASQTIKILERKLAQTRVFAAFDGVVFRTPSDKEQVMQSHTLYPGDTVEMADTLFYVSSTNELLVLATVNQMDINLLSKDMTAKVTSEALPGITLNGEIARLSARASSDETGSSGVRKFDVFIDVSTLPPAVTKQIRLNVSVIATLQVYRNDDAITIPISAVKSSDDVFYVSAMDTDGNIQQRIIQTGITIDSMVEVTAGLQAGDRIWAGPASASGPTSTTGIRWLSTIKGAGIDRIN